MKLSTLLLAGSLAANAALVTVHLLRSPEPPPAASKIATAPNTSSATASSGNSVSAISGQSGWASVQTDDARALSERLRVAGFPEDVIRNIVRRLASDPFNSRRKALLADAEEIPFWKTGQPFYSPYGNDPRTQAAMREIGRDENRFFQELFADGTTLNEGSLALLQRQFGDLPPAKIQQLQRIQTDYNDLRNEIIAARTGGPLLPEDREKLDLLEREQRADFAGVLTPEELFEYDLRSSSTASQLRSRLAGFNPTEEEFRAIFRAQRAFEEKQPADPAANRQLAETVIRVGNVTSLSSVSAIAFDPLIASLDGVLSPERLADLKLAADPAYAMVGRLTARLGLPLDAARQVVAVQQDTQARAGSIRSNRELSPTQRNEQLARLADEAAVKITETLGPRGLEGYMEYGGGWLRTLQPRTTQPEAVRTNP